MTFDEYRKLLIEEIALPSNSDREKLAFLAMGLASESGEVVNEIKRLYVNKSLPLEEIHNELGDTFNFLILLIDHFGFDLDTIMQYGANKMQRRYGKHKLVVK